MNLETKEIIYLVAFALVLRTVVRVYFKYRKEQQEKKEESQNS